MNKKPIALLFSTVWPEPESSAAGVRQMQWIRFLLRLGFEVVLSSPSKPKDGGAASGFPGVRFLPLPMNRSEIKVPLQELAPEIVLFDRFMLEEQFGHWIYECCPDALVLLETVDLHFIRRAREKKKEQFDTYLPMRGVSGDLESDSFFKTETALREIAAIERVDYTFLVSSFEERLLKEQFQIGPESVAWFLFLTGRGLDGSGILGMHPISTACDGF